jgi:hypothetical protein
MCLGGFDRVRSGAFLDADGAGFEGWLFGDGVPVFY